jgi:hypothetical protein
LVAAAAMGAAVARRKGWHFQGLLAAGGINKERFKKGGILKVCRSFFLFFLHTAQQHTATLRPWHRDFLFCSFLALLFFLHRLYFSCRQMEIGIIGLKRRTSLAAIRRNIL